jgi:hypothetical protein
MENPMAPVATAGLKLEIKKLILDTLKIADVKPEDIDDSVSLFENKIGRASCRERV